LTPSPGLREHCRGPLSGPTRPLIRAGSARPRCRRLGWLDQ